MRRSCLEHHRPRKPTVGFSAALGAGGAPADSPSSAGDGAPNRRSWEEPSAVNNERSFGGCLRTGYETFAGKGRGGAWVPSRLFHWLPGPHWGVPSLPVPPCAPYASTKEVNGFKMLGILPATMYFPLLSIFLIL